MVNTVEHKGELPKPIEVLEGNLCASGTTLIRIAFENSFYLDPTRVKACCPRFPGYARKSRKHYPGKNPKDKAIWKGSEVVLDGNQKAQEAWKLYAGRGVVRKSGYGVRHIWGHPWDPETYTAGWNLCYMPFWLGMLTEDQHPHLQLQKAIQQASYDLFFRKDPVCARPDFVKDPGLDLEELLGGVAVNILAAPARSPRVTKPILDGDPLAVVKQIRSVTNVSWISIYRTTRKLQGKPHDPIGTKNVEKKCLSVARRMIRGTGMTESELEGFVGGLAGV